MPPTAGFAQPAGYAGAEQCSANSPLRPWDGPAEKVLAPHAHIRSLPPTGGRMPPWDGPAEA
jgi:hypothetical protein